MLSLFIVILYFGIWNSRRGSSVCSKRLSLLVVNYEPESVPSLVRFSIPGVVDARRLAPPTRDVVSALAVGYCEKTEPIRCFKTPSSKIHVNTVTRLEYSLIYRVVIFRATSCFSGGLVAEQDRYPFFFSFFFSSVWFTHYRINFWSGCTKSLFLVCFFRKYE